MVGMEYWQFDYWFLDSEIQNLPLGMFSSECMSHLLIVTGSKLSNHSAPLSRLTIVSREAKKKQAVRDERVCYLQVPPL